MALEDKETWENVSKGTAAVLIFDRQGFLDQSMVGSGRKVQLSPKEREINQDRAASDSLDIFKNGIMSPVRLLDSTQDAAEIASNANLKSEEDLRAMFKVKDIKKFTASVIEISNTTALNRLKDMAVDEDATIKQLGIIQDHISSIDPFSHDVHVTEIETINHEESPIKAVGPK